MRLTSLFWSRTKAWVDSSPWEPAGPQGSLRTKKRVKSSSLSSHEQLLLCPLVLDPRGSALVLDTSLSPQRVLQQWSHLWLQHYLEE